MKISFNPSNSNKNILDLIKNNKDIIFDLKGHSIFARGVEFKGTDTNTWRPVVDNLTSDSTTSSLSAKQGKVLKALIDGKSNSDHNHDGRYLRLSGQDTMQGNLYLHSHGTSYIGKGLGDKSGADFTEANIVIRSWWGISFKSYDDIVRTYIDTRTGNIGTKGVLNAVGAVIQGRVYNGGDDEGIIINPAPNGSAGLILGTHNGERSVFYLKKGNPFWRYNNGSTNLDIQHPKKPGVIALTSDIPSKDSWNYDDRYLRLTGGWMSGDINFGGDNKIHWGRNTGSASISFKNDGDSYMSFVTSDNEYFRWSSTNTEWMALRSDGLRVRGTKVSLEGHTHDDRYYTKAESNAKYITDRAASAYWKAGWYKVASAQTAKDTEAFLTLDVNAVQSNGHATLFIRKRADSKPYFICTYNNNLNLADFRLYYNGMSMALYARVPNDWHGRVFRIISEGREGKYDHIWTLYSNASSTDPNAISAEGGNPYINPIYSGRVDWSNNSDKANYANSAGNADTVDGQHASAFSYKSWWHWYGKDGQPNWLWGGNNENDYYVYNPSNFRVAYAASAGNADTLDGYHANGSNDRPYGHIPTIESDGVMEVGRYIDFHNDNNGKHDFSTRLQSTGNYGNEVNLPSASGTLALINDVNNYYWANVKISTSSSTTTSPTFSNVYLGNRLYLNTRGSNSIYNGPNDSANGVGGPLNNLVFSSWYGVSFTTSYAGLTYTNKNAVSINCRTGQLYAREVQANGFMHTGHNNNDAVLLAGGGYKTLKDFIFLNKSYKYTDGEHYNLAFHKLSGICNNLVWVDGHVKGSVTKNFVIDPAVFPYRYDSDSDLNTIYLMNGKNFITINAVGVVTINNATDHKERVGFFYVGRA